MPFQGEILYNYKEFETPEPVGLGDGCTVSALGSGKVKVVSQLYHNKKVAGWMTDVLYVPKLTSNLFSINAATLKGNVRSFGHKYCWIRNKKRKLIGTGSPMGKLYMFNCEVLNSPADKATVAGETEGSSKINLWHQRLAHVNVKQLQQLVKNSEGADLQPEGKINFCEACVHGKMYRLPHTANYAVDNAVRVEEPMTTEDALSSNHSKEWKSAADLEYSSLLENKTWELVKLPEGRRTVGCKWVFRVKYDGEGRVKYFKGRLVAQGYSKRYGIDYDEIFAPVARLSSIRILLAFAVENKMNIHQMDVVSAFLNGELKEEIFMQQPPGYVQSGKEDLVCKLKKSIYGLKQSPRCWNEKFCEHMRSLGFKESGADPCIFIRENERKKLEIIAVYVDELILIAETLEEIKHMKSCLSETFKMKNKGEIRYCLGVNFELDENGINLSQKQYLLRLLEKYGLSEANTVSTPMDPNVKLVRDDKYSKSVDLILYQSMVGSLLHAARATRPDIAHAVSIVSKSNSEPSQAHLTAVKRIFRYLKGTLDVTLQYKSTGEKLLGYSDANWAGDLDDRHSTTGNVFVMSGGAVSWLSHKQATVALSTAEAEYIALGSAVQEAMWLLQLLSDLRCDMKMPMEILEDNQGAIAMAKNPVGHKRSKHIDIKHHFIREAVQTGTISLTYCPTSNMLADIFTKPLPKGQFEKLRENLGLISK